jgi:hypothetical protein
MPPSRTTMQDSLTVRRYSLSGGFWTRLGGAAAFPALGSTQSFAFCSVCLSLSFFFFLVSAFGSFLAAMPLHGAMHPEVVGSVAQAAQPGLPRRSPEGRRRAVSPTASRRPCHSKTGVLIQGRVVPIAALRRLAACETADKAVCATGAAPLCTTSGCTGISAPRHSRRRCPSKS